MKFNYQRGYKLMFLLAVLMVVVYAVLGPWMVEVWLGSSEFDSHFVYFAAAGAAFFVALSRWPASAAYALLNTGPLVKIAGAELILKMLLLLLLYPSFTYSSPLFAINIVHLFGGFYLYYWLGKKSCVRQ